jgi:hypothetical protein
MACASSIAAAAPSPATPSSSTRPQPPVTPLKLVLVVPRPKNIQQGDASAASILPRAQRPGGYSPKTEGLHAHNLFGEMPKTEFWEAVQNTLFLRIIDENSPPQKRALHEH